MRSFFRPVSSLVNRASVISLQLPESSQTHWLLNNTLRVTAPRSGWKFSKNEWGDLYQVEIFGRLKEAMSRQAWVLGSKK